MAFHYLLLAYRNLRHGGIHIIIAVAGLSVGLCVALLAALVIHNQLSHDRFMEGYERTYLAISVLQPQGRPPDYNPGSHHQVAALFRLRYPELRAVTRLAEQEVMLRRGQVEARELIYWTDSNLFDVLNLPVHAGNGKAALADPNGLVLTRRTALRYFGRDDPIGETIELDGQHVMSVSAVIEDLPADGTHLQSGIFASGLAAWSLLRSLDNDPDIALGGRGFGISVHTYVQLAPGKSIQGVRNAMPAFMNDIWPNRPPGLGATMEFVRLDRIHVFPGFNPSITGQLLAVGAIGLLVLVVACINFVNLSTSRSLRRAKEMGVRRVVGARRKTLILQFLAESFLHVALAMGLAVLLTSVVLPAANAFLSSGAAFNFAGNPLVVGWIALGAVVIATLTGLYPAFVLSAIKPVDAMRETIAGPSGTTIVRQGLLLFQFAVLIGLLIATAVVVMQRAYAKGEAIRIETDGIVIVEAACERPLMNALDTLAGVASIACTHEAFIRGGRFANLALPGRAPVAIDVVPVEPEAFAVYGVTPSVGADFPVGDDPAVRESGVPYVVINEMAVKVLNYASGEAVGTTLVLPPSGMDEEERIVTIAAVIKDFSLVSVQEEIKPTVYDMSQPHFGLISIKLADTAGSGTLAAIGAAARQAGLQEPVETYFLSDHIDNLYLGILRQSQAFAFFSGVAVLLACLGIIALSSVAAERRLKEVGIRKALGARPGAILGLFIMQFSKPVLLANLLAWPVTAFVMNRWLENFAYRVELEWWLFPLAAAVALALAILAVGINCYSAARLNPATVLRYE